MPYLSNLFEVCYVAQCQMLSRNPVLSYQPVTCDWAWSCVVIISVTTLNVEGWMPRRSERAKSGGEEGGKARGVPVNASCGRTVKWGSKW